MPAASSQKKTLPWSHHKPPCPPPGSVEIACALWGEESPERAPTTVVGIPPKEAKEPLEVMGSSVIATCLFWHPILGGMYIDMLTCTLSIADLGFNTMANDHPVPALQELPNSA